MEILLGMAIFMVAIALLSAGTFLWRRPLQGSCGGAASAMGEEGGNCSVCGRSGKDCPEKKKPTD